MQRALDNAMYQRIFSQPEDRSEGRRARAAQLRHPGIDTDGYFRNSTVLGSITVRRSIRGQWSALEREEKIKFWADDRNNSRPGAYEVGVEHGIVDQAPHVATRLSMAALLPRLLRKPAHIRELVRQARKLLLQIE